MNNLRDDLRLIYDWVPAGSRVLDLGCGRGELLSALVREKQCTGYGVEIDTEGVLASIANGINVIQADLDIIILSQTIQAMQNTENILRDLTRVAKQAVVSFPNFGYWRNRLQIALGGHMPVSERMPYQWYNTPNIHWCTLHDFDALCAKNNIRILERAVMTAGKRIETLPNLMGSLAFYRVG